MAKTAKKKQTPEEARWDAALEGLGRDAVITKLGSHEMRADGGAEFKLRLPDGGRSPKRGYVEDWLGRTAAAAKATDTKRFRYILIASVVAAVVAAAAAIHDWIR